MNNPVREYVDELETDHAEALGALNRVTAERDQARRIAVHLEKETAHLRSLAAALTAELQEMHDKGDIDLGLWPAARALVEAPEGATWLCIRCGHEGIAPSLDAALAAWKQHDTTHHPADTTTRHYGDQRKEPQP